MRYQTLLAPSLIVLAVGTGLALVFSSLMTSQAVQAPKLSLDMDPSGNAYSDPGGGGNNSMTVGAIDNCLTTAAPGNNNTHIHPAQIIIRDVEDLVGWQVRLNYLGDRMRPGAFNAAPFTDTLRGQAVSFVNLPIDAGTAMHRDVFPASSIPAPAPGPQTALVGSVYTGPNSAPISPDTPAKAVPDDSSYNAPTGGVVAALDLEVPAGQAGQPSLFMNLDDASPNPPGSKAVVFTGTGQQEINLASSALGDGYHGEGATCVPLDCVNAECPPLATPTSTPPSAAGHDANLRPIQGVNPEIQLSPGEVINDSAKLTVVNNSNHTDTIGVYVDIRAPGSLAGCTPTGRLLQTTVTVRANGKTTVNVPVSYSCVNPALENGARYNWAAVTDHGADDLASCPVHGLTSASCINALNNDDESGFAGHVKTHSGPQVIAE